MYGNTMIEKAHTCIQDYESNIKRLNKGLVVKKGLVDAIEAVMSGNYISYDNYEERKTLCALYGSTLLEIKDDEKRVIMTIKELEMAANRPKPDEFGD